MSFISMTLFQTAALNSSCIFSALRFTQRRIIASKDSAALNGRLVKINSKIYFLYKQSALESNCQHSHAKNKNPELVLNYRVHFAFSFWNL